MIADLALALALAWWVALAWFFFTLRRSMRDPDLMVKVLRKLGSVQPQRISSAATQSTFAGFPGSNDLVASHRIPPARKTGL